MNQRIKDIFEQACFETEYDDGQNLRETMDRFAELIVREVDQVITNQMREYRFDERVHLGLGDVRFTIGMQEDILKKVKQHFGVEE